MLELTQEQRLALAFKRIENSVRSVIRMRFFNDSAKAMAAKELAVAIGEEAKRGLLVLNPCPLCESEMIGFAVNIVPAKRFGGKNLVEISVGCYRSANNQGCLMPVITTSSPHRVLEAAARVLGVDAPDIGGDPYFIAHVRSIVDGWNSLTPETAARLSDHCEKADKLAVPAIMTALIIDEEKWKEAINEWFQQDDNRG